MPKDFVEGFPQLPVPRATLRTAASQAEAEEKVIDDRLSSCIIVRFNSLRKAQETSYTP